MFRTWGYDVMKLNEARAIITGGGSGLGLAVAAKLYSSGARVAVLDINEKSQHTVASTVAEDVLFIPTDVSSEASVDDALDLALAKLGAVTLAVNCAGVAQSKRVIGRDSLLNQDEFSEIININLIGTFNVCRTAAQVMSTNIPDEGGERGVIINTASISAFEGQIGQAAYAASKGGVTSLTLPLAREFARFGIRVIAIAPGIFETPLIEDISQPAKEHLIQSVPFPHRLGDPVEFADLVCSIYQIPMLNGEVIRLDGALRMPVI